MQFYTLALAHTPQAAFNYVACHPLVVLPVVPVFTPSGPSSPETVAKAGSRTAAPLVCWTGNSIYHIMKCN